MANAESVLKPITISPEGEHTRPFFDQAHDWIVTVDHKKLGLMYIMYGILFLVIGADDLLEMNR